MNTVIWWQNLEKSPDPLILSPPHYAALSIRKFLSDFHTEVFSVTASSEIR